MNKINRSLVKSQAKQIIKEKIFALFVLSAIVLFLVNGLTVGISAYNSRNNLEDIFGQATDQAITVQVKTRLRISLIILETAITIMTTMTVTIQATAQATTRLKASVKNILRQIK